MCTNSAIVWGPHFVALDCLDRWVQPLRSWMTKMTKARAKDRLKLTQEEAFPGLMIPPFLIGSWLTTVIAGGTTLKYGAEWEAAASKRMCLRGICGHNCYTLIANWCKLTHGFLHKSPRTRIPSAKHQTSSNHSKPWNNHKTFGFLNA